MADSDDWRSSLTASERYDNIQKLSKAVSTAGLSQNGYMLETEAFRSSNSRQEYESACAISFDAEEPHASTAADKSSDSPVSGDDDDTETDPGIRIGSYQNCNYVASGVTAEVYRCKDRALKVIVETRDIEPHNPFREAKILGLLSRPCVPLLESFRDQEQRFVLVFPYMPLTLSTLLENQGPNPLPTSQLRPIFTSLFKALHHIHSQGIIHRDIKPSAVLLSSSSSPPTPATGPHTIYLSDFGTAWHPTLSGQQSEPPDAKILDIGTGPYRSPEALFGNRSYGTAVDMWAAGVMLAECLSSSGKPLFESRPAYEDGNQLGLILSIFKTIGSPTRETWPEAVGFKTPPFDMYRSFERREWDVVLPEVEPGWRDLVARLVRYESRERATAQEALHHGYLKVSED